MMYYGVHMMYYLFNKASCAQTRSSLCTFCYTMIIMMTLTDWWAVSSS